MSRPVDALLDFLRAEQIRGVTHIHLDDDAKALLRDLHRRAREPQVQPPQKPPAAVSASPPPVAEPAVEAAPPAVMLPPVEAPASGTAAQRIAALAARAEEWEPARRLGTLRSTMVFSTGNPEADIMLVGEAPGYQEEMLREPFVGPAGQKLTEILKAMGLSRSEVYISNIVKFRPATPSQTTNNRKPTMEEMASCLPFVRSEVEIVRPRCIVALGGTAAEGLLGFSGSVSSMRGSWHEFDGIPVRVTYHPSYLLRSSSVRDKRAVWEDMLEVMEKLGMPVSERQRAFFLPKP